MMTMEMVMELLGTLGEDVTVYAQTNGDICVTVEDFEGFDEDYNEVDRDYDEDAVEAVYDKLSDTCISEDGDYYCYFHFEGFTVIWGMASMDI